MKNITKNPPFFKLDFLYFQAGCSSESSTQKIKTSIVKSQKNKAMIAITKVRKVNTENKRWRSTGIVGRVK